MDVAWQLAIAGVIVRAERPSLLAEEASLAYRDVTNVVRVAGKVPASCDAITRLPAAGSSSKG